MPSTLTEMGALLNSWSECEEIGLVETAQAVTVSSLNADKALELLETATGANAHCEIHDNAGELAVAHEIDDNFGPFIATIEKPVATSDRLVLTYSGLSQALSEDNAGIWQIANCGVPFASGLISFNRWGEADVFSRASPTKSPLDLVRESAEVRLVPADIRKWLLRSEVSGELWRDETFQVFASESTPALLRSLATEIIGVSELTFSGPPRLCLKISQPLELDSLGMSGYSALQEAVSWIYEDPMSAEQRHALFAAEFARSIHRNEKIEVVFRTAGKEILVGSRLAYQLSQSELSRESIKAQADLRKAIADDTLKASENTRSLAGAIAIAIATGVTLVGARATRVTEPWIIATVACVAAVYLLVIAWNGCSYLALQNKLREQWRIRFYRFIPEDDYKEMVTQPALEAAKPYNYAALVALLVAVLLVLMALITLTSNHGAHTPSGTEATQPQSNNQANQENEAVTPPPH